MCRQTILCVKDSMLCLVMRLVMPFSKELKKVKNKLKDAVTKSGNLTDEK